MKLITRTLPALIIIFFSVSTYAQRSIIELDTLTLTPSAPLPFDEPFVLKIPVQSDNISSVLYIQHAGHKTLAETDRQHHLNVVNIDNFSVKKQNNQYYLLVNINNPNLLNPGKLYSFIYVSADAELIRAFYKYHLYKKGGPKTNLQEALEIVKKMGDDYKKATGIEAVFSPTDDKKNQNTLETCYQNTQQANLIVNLGKYDATLNYQLPSKIPQGLSDNLGLRKLSRSLIERTDLIDPDMKPVLFKDPKITMAQLNALNQLSTIKDYQDIISGIKPIICDNCTPTKQDDYIERYKNIKLAYFNIRELLNATTALDTDTDIKNAIVSLKLMEQDLMSTMASFKAISDASEEIMKDFSKLKLGHLNVVDGSSMVKTFESRSKLSIAPDFGIVTTRISKNESNPYPFVPYLGVHVNLRPLNRDVSFSSYKHKFINYWSLFVGWSLVNIKNGPKITANADSITGFFNGDKGTLLAGFGFRLSNAIKLTGGAMSYFKYKSEPSNPTFYGSRQLKAWPFIGISIDLALKDLLNGVSDVFSAAPKTYKPPIPATNQ